jgi:hypothetical protein
VVAQLTALLLLINAVLHWYVRRHWQARTAPSTDSSQQR